MAFCYTCVKANCSCPTEVGSFKIVPGKKPKTKKKPKAPKPEFPLKEFPQP